MKNYIFILLFFSSLFISTQLKANNSNRLNTSDSLELVLKTWKEKDSLAQWLNIQKKRSQTFRAQGEFDKSLAILNSTINNIWRTPASDKEQIQLAWIFVNRAYLFEIDGFFLEAQADYIEADKCFINLKLENYNVSRFVWHPLGNIYTRLGENELAAYFIQKSLNMYAQLNASSDLVDAYNDLGIIQINLNNYKKAIETLQEGIKLRAEDPLNNTLLHNSKALAHKELKEYEEGLLAIDSTFYYLDKANEFYSGSQYYKELISKYSINSHTFKGLLLLKINQTENAEKELKAALHYRSLYKNEKHRKIARAYLGLAESKLEQKQPLKALNYYQKALTAALLKFNDSTLFSNPNPENLYAEVLIGKTLLGKAKSSQNQYYIDQDLKWLLLAKECYQLYFSWEKQIRSEYYYESSKLRFTEELHQATESALELLFLLQKVQPEEDWAKQAFQYIEQSKGVILSESTVNLFQQIPELKNDSILLQLQLSKKQYRLLANKEDTSDRREKLQEAILVLENDLRERFPYYHKTKSNANNTLSLALLNDYLEQQNAELSSYFVGNSSVFYVHIKDNNYQLHTIDRKQYQGNTKQFRKALNNPKVSAINYEIAAHQLYKLLSPHDVSKKNKDLIVIPDGELNLIPFEALVNQKTEQTPTFKSLSYLVKDKAISYSPSAKFLLRTQERRQLPNSFLGIAPDFSNSTNAFLKFATAEVEHGKNSFGGKLLTGNSIKKEEIINQLANYQIIHWVSHAGLDSNSTNGAWIAVNSKEQATSRLFPPELLPIQLSTSLLTLNACETGVGTYKAGEGIYSLSRGFAYAGAQNIVTNLWQANHEVSNQLMNAFYSNLAQKGNISSALMQAKKKYLASENTDEFGAHPYFWAAPILIGNNHNLQLKKTTNHLTTILFVLIGFLVLALAFFLIKKALIKKSHA